MYRSAWWRTAVVAGALALAVPGLGTPSAFAASRAAAVWLMDETSGTTMTDTSGNGNNGTTYNVKMTGASGYKFDPASRSKVVVPNSATLNPGASTFSYSLKMQSSHVPASGTDYDLMRKGIGTTTGGEYKIEIVYGLGLAKAYCVVQDSRGHEAGLRGTHNLADNQLHTVSCKKTATALIMTEDGGRARKKSASLGSVTNTAPLTLGVKVPDSPENDLKQGDWYKGTMRSATISIEP